MTTYADLTPLVGRCDAARDLEGPIAGLSASVETILGGALSASITDAPVQRRAAVSLFALLPEVLALSAAGKAIADTLGLDARLADVPSDANGPIGSLPPFPTATPATTPSPLRDPFVNLPRLSVSIWRASVRYFGIGGKNPSQLESSDQKNIPRSADGDKVQNAFAYVEVTANTLQPTYVANPASGTCTMLGSTGKMTYRVTIPRWTSPSRVLPQLLTWWKAVLEHVRWHEEQHVRIFEKWVPILGKRLAGHACTSAGSIEKRWSLDLATAQAAFDATEATWYLKYPYAGPWIN